MKTRCGMARVEVLIPTEEYDELEAIAQDARIGIGPLIRAALRTVADKREIARSISRTAA